jgi:hypothetical protein
VGIASAGTPARIRSLIYGMRVNLRFAAKSTSLGSRGGYALTISVIRFTKAAGPRKEESPRRFFYSLVTE